MAARWMSVREAARQGQDTRTEQDVDLILDFVKDVKFIAKLSELQKRALCQIMTVEERGLWLDFERAVYMERSANIAELVVMAPIAGAPCPNSIHGEGEKCDCPERPFEQLVYLQKGMGFGELALQSDEPRSATIITGEPTVTLVVNKSSYEQLAGHLHKRFTEDRVRFLLKFPKVFEAIDRHLVTMKDLSAMANLLSERRLGGNEILVRQGEVVDNLVFVRQGHLTMIRTIDVDLAKAAITAGDTSKQASLGEAGKEQSSGALAHNLARAMLAMRKQQRETRFEEIEAKKTPPQDMKHFLKYGQASTSSGSASPKHAPARPAMPVGPGSPKAPVAAPPKMPKAEAGKDAKDAAAKVNRTASAGRAFKWKKLQSAFGKAISLKSLTIGPSTAIEPDSSVKGEVQSLGEIGEADTKRNLEQLMDVNKARKVATEFNYKKAIEEKRKSKTIEEQTLPSEGKDAPHRFRLLNVGHLGPCQYFGHEQICNSGIYPYTLMSDPIADCYLMSKHDIVRRLPKKLFNLLFTTEKEAVPTDAQLFLMLKQNDRWTDFRCFTRESEAVVRQRGRVEVNSWPLREKTWARSKSNVDPATNLAFLGITPKSPIAAGKAAAKARPRPRQAVLTTKDQEMFSDSPAGFLRGLEINKRDKELDKEYKRHGIRHWQSGGKKIGKRDLDDDPSTFIFEKNWVRCGNFPALDLGDEEVEQGVEKRQASKEEAGMSMGPTLSSFSFGGGDVSVPKPKRSTSKGVWPEHGSSASPASRSGSKGSTSKYASETGGAGDAALDSRPSSRASPSRLVREPPFSVEGRPEFAATPSPATPLPASPTPTPRAPSDPRPQGMARRRTVMFHSNG
mmetsp:Transcript_100624/g.324742  ORF Transcript_100624/g.324742 Transcript_100624/m.324742 type:complete len:849 (-) Transcript_100624:179-2725(-)